MRNIIYYDTGGTAVGASLEGLTYQHSLFRMKWASPVVDLPVPLLIRGTYMWAYNYGLKEVYTNFDKLKYGEGMFRGDASLTHVKYGFPSLVDAPYMFNYCALPAEEIDKILESLPSYTDGPDKHRIGFSGCPGCATCHPEIGRNKGWNVVL